MPLYVIWCFSFSSFYIYFVCLVFVSLINMCLGVYLWIYPIWDSLGFWTWVAISFHILGWLVFLFFYFYPLKYFFLPFPFVFYFWDTYGLNVGALAFFQKSLRLSSFLFLLFSLFHFYLPAYYLFFCLSYSTVGSLQSIFNSVISLFFSD